MLKLLLDTSSRVVLLRNNYCISHEKNLLLKLDKMFNMVEFVMRCMNFVINILVSQTYRSELSFSQSVGDEALEHCFFHSLSPFHSTHFPLPQAKSILCTKTDNQGGELD